jgi:hypothetical protein
MTATTLKSSGSLVKKNRSGSRPIRVEAEHRSIDHLSGLVQLVAKLDPASATFAGGAEHVMIGHHQARGHQEPGSKALQRFALVTDLDEAPDRNARLARDVVWREFVEIERPADPALLEVRACHPGARIRTLLGLFAFEVLLDFRRRIGRERSAAPQPLHGLGAPVGQPPPAFTGRAEPRESTSVDLGGVLHGARPYKRCRGADRTSATPRLGPIGPRSGQVGRRARRPAARRGSRRVP